jgi:protein phosphatase PTC2/3
MNCFDELAEFRGPGVHHNFDDSDSNSGYDAESENKKSYGMGGYKGRIIFLGDGTEVLTDSDDTEMFDNTEEDKDLASQVSKDDKPAEGTSTGDESKGGSHPGRKLGEDEKVDTGAAPEQASTGTETKAEPQEASTK